MKDLIRSTLLVTIARVAGIIVQSLIVIFLARELTIADMGIFALCYAGLGLARALGPMGMDQVTMRQAAAADDRTASNQKLHTLLNTSRLLVIGINTALAVMIVLLAAVASNWLPANYRLSYSGILSVTCAIPAFALIGLLTGNLRGFDRNLAAQLPDSVMLQLLFALGIAFFFARGERTLDNVLLCLAIAAWLTVALYLVLCLHTGIIRAAQPSRHAARDLLSQSREAFFALSVTALSVRAPILISTAILGPAATAILDIATRFGTVPTITTSSVAATFSPRFSALGNSGDIQPLSRTLSLASLLAAVPALVYLAAIAIGAPALFGAILPPAYAGAYVPLLLIGLACAVNAAFGIASNLLFMTGHSRIVKKFSLGQLGIIVVLALPLGVLIGTQGFAIAILAGAILRDFGMALWASRHFKIKLPPFGLVN